MVSIIWKVLGYYWCSSCKDIKSCSKSFLFRLALCIFFLFLFFDCCSIYYLILSGTCAVRATLAFLLVWIWLCRRLLIFFELWNSESFMQWTLSDSHLWDISGGVFGPIVCSTSSKTSQIISSLKYILGYTFLFSRHALGSYVSQNLLSVISFPSMDFATPCISYLLILQILVLPSLFPS